MSSVLDRPVSRNARQTEPARPNAAALMDRCRELLAELYPTANHASLVVNLGAGVPPAVLVVIPNPAAGKGGAA